MKQYKTLLTRALTKILFDNPSIKTITIYYNEEKYVYTILDVDINEDFYGFVMYSRGNILDNIMQHFNYYCFDISNKCLYIVVEREV